MSRIVARRAPGDVYRIAQSAIEHRQTPTAAYAAQVGKDNMLSTIVIVLIILWLLGMATSYTLGGLVHVLLVIAIVVVLIRIIQGRNPLKG